MSILLPPTTIFHDSLLRPKFVDLSSVDWSYPLHLESTMNLRDTRSVRNNVYRSRRIDISQLFLTAFKAVDMSIYLHQAKAPVFGCVRVYAWKRKPNPYTPNAEGIRYQRVGREDFYDFTPICFTQSLTSAVFNLKVDDTWDEFQLFISQPCTAVTVYMNPADPQYPNQYIKITGGEPNDYDLEPPIQDDFLGDNYDWENP